jgi:hypothetical protein
VLERGIERGAVIVENDLEGALTSFGRGFTVLEGELSQEVTAELKQAAKALAKVRVLRWWQGARGRVGANS